MQSSQYLCFAYSSFFKGIRSHFIYYSTRCKSLSDSTFWSVYSKIKYKKEYHIYLYHPLIDRLNLSCCLILSLNVNRHVFIGLSSFPIFCISISICQTFHLSNNPLNSTLNLWSMNICLIFASFLVPAHVLLYFN